MDLTDLNALKQNSANRPVSPDKSVGRDLQQTAPQLPPRTAPAVNSNPYGGMVAGGYGASHAGFGANSFYNSFGTGGYGGSYGAGGMGSLSPYAAANAYGGTNNSSNSFLRAAENSSRTAFQSIESVVYAFSAVSAMFESTYCAVYNSFRAVVGVADQFYRLKTQLTGIVSALAIFRFLKHMLRKLLRLLRLSSGSPENESAWASATGMETESLVKNSARATTNWPIIMFFAVVVGGPYLIWKILSSIDGIHKDDSLWMSGKIDHFIAVSEYDFEAENVDELSFRRGQRIIIAPKEYQPKLRGWLLGTVDGTTQGIMPANYMKILGKKQAEPSNPQQTAPAVATPAAAPPPPKVNSRENSPWEMISEACDM